jgi:hypothetical protein
MWPGRQAAVVNKWLGALLCYAQPPHTHITTPHTFRSRDRARAAVARARSVAAFVGMVSVCVAVWRGSLMLDA